MISSRFINSLLAFVCLVYFLPASALAGGDDWKPIDPADLALKTPVVEKDADAEAIFWEVMVDDNPEGDLIFTHYIRIKIFTDRGRESQSKIDIPFGEISGNNIKISNIAARTIKADGTIVELKKDDIFERTIVKASGVKVKAKSFAMPAVEPGAIIEYRWKEIRVHTDANYVRLEMQRDIPVQRVKYYLKPFPFEGLSMRSLTLHGNNSPFTKEKNGFSSTMMTNVPALHTETRMPPEDQVQTWMLVYYTRENKIAPEKYWNDWGRQVYEAHKPNIKVNDEVRQAATEAVGDATTPEQKLQRLYDYVRAKIKNINDDASGLTAEERAKAKVNKSPSDTLKRGQGTGLDRDMLFGALAIATGLDAHIVELPDRSDFFFDPGISSAYFMRTHSIAVRMGEEWRFFDPSNAYIPLGMLPWWKEGERGLILDSKEPIWIHTPTSSPEKSRVKRTAKIKLLEDGTVEGDVQLEFTGHLAVERKAETDSQSAAEREKNLTDEVKSRMSTAELSNIRIENAADSVKPFICAYHVRVPGYAQKTGKRLFLQPGLFEHGAGPLFSASERKYPVYFHYAWSEEDEVIIELPEGYALDNADAPATFSGGPVSAYKPGVAVTKDGKTLIYKRNFFFGGGGTILFPPQGYPQLKNYFDMLHKEDNHTITLKQGVATSGSN